jgi:putative hemolysin
MKRLLFMILVVVVVGLGACGGEPEPTAAPAGDAFDSPLHVANPASVYCVEQGYELEIRTEAEGQVGYCIFDDGTECEEWAFYRGECAPGTPAP